MNWLDWTIVAVIGVSTLVSLQRGFVKEALSLLGWVIAFLVATTFSSRVSDLLAETISNDALRLPAAYAILFIATLMLTALFNNLVGQLIKMTGLSGLDRLLGTVFGFARGLIVVVVIVYLAQSIMPQPQDGAQPSVLLPQLMLMVEWAQANFANLLADGKLPWQ